MTDIQLDHDVILLSRNKRQIAPEIEVTLTAEYFPGADRINLTSLEQDGIFINQHKGTEDEAWLWKRVQSDLDNNTELRSRVAEKHSEQVFEAA